MSRLGVTIVVATSILLTVTENTPAADEPEGLVPIPDYSGDLWQRSHLTGDWGGARTDVANKGVQLDVDWTQYGQGIVDGGLNRTTRYGGHFDYVARFDLMRMGLVPGALVTVRAETRYGASVNGSAGTVLPVNTTAFFPLTDNFDDDVAIAVTDLNFTQFLSPQLAVTVGKIDTLDADPNEFASGRGKSQFMDANFLFNSTLGLRLPYSTLGVAASWFPNDHFKIEASVVNTADSSTSSGFDDFGDGVTATVEADFQYRLRELPGGMNVGGLYSFDQDFSKVGGKLIFTPGEGLSIEDKDSTWAIYWSAWQYLFVEQPAEKPIDPGDGTPDLQGVGLFARAGVADENTNPVNWSLSIGVGGRGIIPTRDDDTFGVGYFYTRLQETRLTIVGVGDDTQGFEAFYNVAITPAAHLTFDVQFHDTALPDVDTAVIFGVRLNLTI